MLRQVRNLPVRGDAPHVADWLAEARHVLDRYGTNGGSGTSTTAPLWCRLQHTPRGSRAVGERDSRSVAGGGAVRRHDAAPKDQGMSGAQHSGKVRGACTSCRAADASHY